MSLIPFKSFFDQEDPFDNDNWLMPVFPRSEISKPAIDVYETDKDVVAEVSIPNFDPEKIDVSVEDGILKVAGHVEEKTEDKGKGYWKKEIRSGSFERIIRLPTAVKEDSIDAEYDKGILKITLPKLEKKSLAKVKVKVK